MKETILNQFKNIHVYTEQGKPSLHKPVLSLYVLAQYCYS